MYAHADISHVLDRSTLKSVEMAVGEPYGANRYIKGHPLGEGTYGVVFKAIDKVVKNQLLLLDNADSHHEGTITQ